MLCQVPSILHWVPVCYARSANVTSGPQMLDQVSKCFTGDVQQPQPDFGSYWNDLCVHTKNVKRRAVLWPSIITVPLNWCTHKLCQASPVSGWPKFNLAHCLITSTTTTTKTTTTTTRQWRWWWQVLDERPVGPWLRSSSRDQFRCSWQTQQTWRWGRCSSWRPWTFGEVC